MLTYITTLSVLFQFAAVAYAMRLIRVSGSRAAWFLISAAILGMAVRRVMVLFGLLFGDPFSSADLSYELIGLVTSLLILFGIVSIAPIFEADRKKEEALRRSRERYRRIIETAQEGIIKVDAAGRIAYLNDRFAGMLGYKVPEIQKRPLADFLADPTLPILRAKPEMRGGTTWEQHEMAFRRKDGGELWAILSTSPILEDGEKEISSLWMITDITNRKHVEMEREEMVRRLREAMANVKALSGLLPICASCKNIRDDQGYWNRIEEYITNHSEAVFSHSICPDCRKKLYPDFNR